MCLESTADLPSIGLKFKGLDKIVHGTFHFIFTMLWFLFFKNKNHTFKKSLAIAFTMSVVYGITIELLQQQFTTTRQGDYLDILSNIAGALLGVLVINRLQKKDFFKDFV